MRYLFPSPFLPFQLCLVTAEDNEELIFLVNIVIYCYLFNVICNFCFVNILFLVFAMAFYISSYIRSKYPYH